MRIKNKEIISEKKNIFKLELSNGLKHHCKDYCKSTSIHGIKYFGEDYRPTGERICWVLMFIVCISFNSYSIYKVWNKWNESPVIVSFAEVTTPVWNIPFPAVTICSVVKSRATEFNFSSYLTSNDTDEEIEKKKGDVSLFCDDHIQVDGPDFADDSTMDFLNDVAPPFNDTILICRWQANAKQNCSNIFTRIVTDEGVCYTFNMLDKNDLFRENVKTYFESDGLRERGWTLDEGYSLETFDAYPERALQAGPIGGLFTVITAKPEDYDYECSGFIQGFKILLHSPAEFPMIGDRYLRVPLGQELLVTVRPSIMTTSDGLKSYTPQQRHCYFPAERYLSYFKVYTQPNCELECLTNYTRSKCGCVALQMPRKGDTKLCGPGKKKCMIEAANKLRISEVITSYKNEKMGNCDCLPACTSIGYNAESSQTDYNFHAVLAAYGDNVTEYLPYNASRLSIFFKDTQFTTVRRNELYVIVDFLASCGGLLGLFCGVSFLSIVELIYYTTLRIWGNARAVKKGNKKNEEMDDEQCK